MQIKVFQLNMWAGAKFPAIESFLRNNDFDILCFQEVAGPHTYCGNVKCEIDCFAKLQSVLGESYIGEIAIFSKFTSDPINSFEGNAIFYKKSFSALNKNVLHLYDIDTPFPSEATSYEGMPRNVLHLKLQQVGRNIDVLSTHLAWARTSIEQPHQREQNLKLIEYMKTLEKPWIITGDFNINPNQPSILDLEKIGRNLIKESNIPNTLDPLNHLAWDEIKPGFSVDYIFTSPDIKVEEFKVLDTQRLSDHFGLTASIEV